MNLHMDESLERRHAVTVLYIEPRKQFLYLVRSCNKFDGRLRSVVVDARQCQRVTLGIESRPQGDESVVELPGDGRGLP